MKERVRRDSGRLMLISPERVFYAGLLGRPRRRISGGFNFYVSLQGELTIIEGGSERIGEVAALPPYASHSIASEFPSVICVVVEPETVEPRAMHRLLSRLGGSDAIVFAARARAAYHDLRRRQRADGFTTAEFDRLLFGAPLPERRIDPRIRRVAALLDDFSGGKMTAEDCAARLGLSRSRLLHLFKDEIGVPFRAFRAWKRARHLLHFVNENLNLAHLAQDMGYPDSTHFSHSIRRFYGLKPRAIFSGSRDLAIYRSRVALPLGAGP
jgi:AraC-like DNA-binding protein